MIPYFVLILTFALLSETKFREGYPFRIVAVTILILFIGLRNEVGTDYNSYSEIFQTSAIVDADSEFTEPGWLLLNKFVGYFTDDFKGVALVHATLLVLLLHFSLKDFKYYTAAFVLFILLEHGYIFIVNGMRQGLAMAFFFYSWRFIKSRKALKYWICILLAASVHVSILFISPIYWFAQRKYPFRFYLIVQFLTLFMFFTHFGDNLFPELMELTSYSDYVESQFMESVVNSGMRFMTVRMGLLFVLLYYRRLFKDYPQYIVPLNMFFIAIIFGDLFANTLILNRMTHYFEWSSFIVLPVFLSAVFKRGFSLGIAWSFVLASVLFFFIYRAYTDVENNLFYTF